MTLTNVNRTVSYIGNAATTEFSYGFPVPAQDALLVQITDLSHQVVSTLTLGQYTVTGIGSSTGGIVTYPGAGSGLSVLPATQRLRITRVTPNKQELLINNQQTYYADAVMGALDKQMMISQELSDDLSRALRFPLGETMSAFPSAVERANKYLKFSSSGQAIAAALPDPQLVVPTFFEQWRYMTSSDLALIRAGVLTGQDVSRITSGLRQMLEEALAYMLSADGAVAVVILEAGLSGINRSVTSSDFLQTLWDSVDRDNSRMLITSNGPVIWQLSGWLDGTSAVRTDGIYGELGLSYAVPKAIFEWSQPTGYSYLARIDLDLTIRGEENLATDPVGVRLYRLNNLQTSGLIEVERLYNTTHSVEACFNCRLDILEAGTRTGWQLAEHGKAGLLNGNYRYKNTGTTIQIVNTSGTPVTFFDAGHVGKMIALDRQGISATDSEEEEAGRLSAKWFTIASVGPGGDFSKAVLDSAPAYTSETDQWVLDNRRFTFAAMRATTTAGSAVITLSAPLLDNLVGRTVTIFGAGYNDTALRKVGANLRSIVTAQTSTTITLADAARYSKTLTALIVSSQVEIGTNGATMRHSSYRKNDDVHMTLRIENGSYGAVPLVMDWCTGVTFRTGTKVHGCGTVNNNWGGNFANIVGSRCKFKIDGKLTHSMHSPYFGKFCFSGPNVSALLEGQLSAWTADTNTALYYLDPDLTSDDFEVLDAMVEYSAVFPSLSAQQVMERGPGANRGLVKSMRPEQKRPLVLMTLGQSNVVGVGDGGSLVLSPRVKLFDTDGISVGTMFNQATFGVKPLNKGTDVARVNNMMAHAASQLAERLDRDVYLIIVADGGHPMEAFISDASLTANGWTRSTWNNLYAAATASLAAALPLVPGAPTKIDMLFVHQGEANRTDPPHLYAHKFRTMVADLEAAGYLDSEEVVVVAGEICTIAHTEYYERHAAALDALTQQYTTLDLPGFRVASSVGVEAIVGNEQHFTGKGLVEFGRRFAEAALSPRVSRVPAPEFHNLSTGLHGFTTKAVAEAAGIKGIHILAPIPHGTFPFAANQDSNISWAWEITPSAADFYLVQRQRVPVIANQSIAVDFRVKLLEAGSIAPRAAVACFNHNGSFLSWVVATATGPTLAASGDFGDFRAQFGAGGTALPALARFVSPAIILGGATPRHLVNLTRMSINVAPGSIPALGIAQGVRRTISANTTVALDDNAKQLSCTSSVTLTLPATPFTGFEFIVTASATSLVTLAPQGGNTVEPDSLVYPGSGAKFVFDGTVWRRYAFRGFGMHQSGSFGLLPDQSSIVTPTGFYQITTSTLNVAKPSHMTATTLAALIEQPNSLQLTQTVWDPARPQDGRWTRHYISGAWSTTWTSTGYVARMTVANLPTNATEGSRCYVTDANATTFAAVVAGGGANKLPVSFNGTNWTIG